MPYVSSKLAQHDYVTSCLQKLPQTCRYNIMSIFAKHWNKRASITSRLHVQYRAVSRVVLEITSESRHAALQ